MNKVTRSQIPLALRSTPLSPAFGYFTEDFERIDLEALPHAPRGLGKLLARFRTKAWQHFALITPTHWLGLAVMDARYGATAWCYAYDRRQSHLVEHALTVGPGMARVPRNHWDDLCRLKTERFSLQIRNLLRSHRHELAINVALPGQPPIRGEVIVHTDETRPLIPFLPLPTGGGFYTQKQPCAVEGELSIGDTQLRLDRETSFGLVDLHRARYPHHTHWRWAACAGRLADGRLLGLNLTCGTAFPPGDRLTENALWVGRTLSLLGPADFDLGPSEDSPWLIKTQDGRCALRFVPEGARTAKTQLGPVRTRYRQPFGHFEGYAVDDEGTRHPIEGLFGCGEDHDTYW